MLPPNGAWPGSRGPFKVWQNSGDISKTAQYSDTVTTGGYQKIIRSLSNGDVADTLE